MAEKKPDYYTVLGITRDATPEEIKKAYHKQALKYHPDRNSVEDKEESERRFKEVAEAFEVLGNEESKTKYDRGNFPQKFTPSPPRDIFEAFFGAQNPFSWFGYQTPQPKPPPQPVPDPYRWNGPPGGPPPQGYPPKPQSTQYPPPQATHNPPPPIPLHKNPPITTDLPCTLEELFMGAEKKIKITRRTYDKSGFYLPVEKILEVKLVPGWKAGTKITFAGEGDEVAGTQPADLIFVVSEKPHGHFTRDKNDLITTKKITLLEALSGCAVSVVQLNGQTLEVPMDDIVRPGQRKIIPKEGFISSRDGSRGDLIIEFQVVFPLYLTPLDKEELKAGALSKAAYF